MIDADVAELYGVETRELAQAIRNNPEKFPDGYVMQLEKEEVDHLRSKILTANISTKSRVLPRAFTEKGLYMLATILKGRQAIERVNGGKDCEPLRGFCVLNDFWRNLGGKRWRIITEILKGVSCALDGRSFLSALSALGCTCDRLLLRFQIYSFL